MNLTKTYSTNLWMLTLKVKKLRVIEGQAQTSRLKQPHQQMAMLHGPMSPVG